ncbi:MAG: divergent PAP2 family protein [Spirochaetia bacterium]|jgi:acid phosphatase family membrane protein YuiD|nr:divergent PAP2 family protein [Spirochaetia bacterium]
MENNLLHNAPFFSALVACLLAQLLKPLVLMATGEKFDRKMLTTTGGMPSSHTAGVIGLVTSVAMTNGIASSEFAISCVFAAIVIHDAMGIRQAAGKQAEVINEWSKLLSSLTDGTFTPANLKTMLGHSLPQVFFGAVLGLIVGFLLTFFWPFG